MFDYIHNNKAAQFAMKGLLAVIAVGFVGFGSYSFMDGGGPQDVAEVGDVVITQRDVQNALADQGRGPDDAERVTQELIQRAVFLQKARDMGVRISDEELARAIHQIPAFQKNGRFDPETYRKALRDNKMTVEQFEGRMREDLLMGHMQEVFVTVIQGGFYSRKSNEALINFVAQKRPVSTIRVEAAAFKDKVVVTDKQVEDYYKANSNEFRLPEQVRAEYVHLTVDALKMAQTVSEQEIAEHYASRREAYDRDERQARHILILAPAGDEAGRKVARQRVEGLLQQARANPTGFAALATANSQDPATAPQGGDLGWLSQKMANAEFKPVIDALFKLQVNGVSDIVETPYGFHIVQMAAQRKLGLTEARGEIESFLKEQKARRLFPQVSDQLAEQALSSDKSLAPVAQAVRLPLQTSEWITREGLANDPVFGSANKEVLEALFSPDGIGGRTSDVLELPEQQRLVVRVVEHKPARLQALAEVTPGIRQKLQMQGAALLAAEEGKRLLAIVQKGGTLPMQWGTPASVSRLEPGPLTADVLKVAMSLPAAQTAYGGVQENGGYTLIQAGAMLPLSVDPAMAQNLQMSRLRGEVDAYLALTQRELVKMAAPKKAATAEQPQ